MEDEVIAIPDLHLEVVGDDGMQHLEWRPSILRKDRVDHQLGERFRSGSVQDREHVAKDKHRCHADGEPESARPRLEEAARQRLCRC